MRPVTNFLLYSFVVVVIAHAKVELEADIPFLRVRINGKADLKCCFRSKTKELLNLTWVRRINANTTLLPEIVKPPEPVNTSDDGQFCGTLTFKSVQQNNTGMYQCWLNKTNFFTMTHGTFLQVYKPLEKTINLSENTKNNILKAEGIILFLCVLLPSATLLLKSKKLNELEKKKVAKEEENIYQGLNLDDCCTTYDQIERSQTHDPYQDVCNIIEEEEEIQLEKP